jgi:acetoacetate decarboxylase
MWLSLFVARQGAADRPAGLYGAAFVHYREGGVLAYRELLVARLVRDGAVPRVRITDIWVDSRTSLEGGRTLWAIPKELADLHQRTRRVGPVTRTAWSARVAGTPIAAAGFTATPGVAPRSPLFFTVFQQREEGTPVVAHVTGSARSLPCAGGWRFGTDGPLAWMRGRRAVASFLLSDFRVTFGG